MTLIELNLFASPLGGVVGALTAAKGLPGTSSLAAAAGGLIVGAALFLAVTGLFILLVDDEKRVARFVGKATSWLGVAAFLLMVALPVVSALAAHWLTLAICA